MKLFGFVLIITSLLASSVLAINPVLSSLLCCPLFTWLAPTSLSVTVQLYTSLTVQWVVPCVQVANTNTGCFVEDTVSPCASTFFVGLYSSSGALVKQYISASNYCPAGNSSQSFSLLAVPAWAVKGQTYTLQATANGATFGDVVTVSIVPPPFLTWLAPTTSSVNLTMGHSLTVQWAVPCLQIGDGNGGCFNSAYSPCATTFVVGLYSDAGVLVTQVYSANSYCPTGNTPQGGISIIADSSWAVLGKTYSLMAMADGVTFGPVIPVAVGCFRPYC